MGINIRSYQKSDKLSIETLFAEFVKHHLFIDETYEKVPSHCDIFIEHIETSLSNPERYCAVAVEQQNVIGYCFTMIQQKPPIYPTPSFGYIDNIAVSEKFQNRGIGLILAQDAIAWLKQKGIQRVECYSALDNPKTAAFWRKLGFKPIMEQLYLKL